MAGNHVHIEATLVAALLTLLIYGGSWLLSLGLPAVAWPVLFIGLYFPAYLVLRIRWRK